MISRENSSVYQGPRTTVILTGHGSETHQVLQANTEVISSIIHDRLHPVSLTTNDWGC